MKNLKKFALLFIATTAITITACDSDSDDDGNNPAPALTAEQKLTGTFLIIDQTITYNDTIIERFSDLDSCDRDDLLIFNANKTGAFDEGATKCDTMDPQSDSFTWSLLSDTRLRVIDEYNSMLDTTDVDIITNNGTNLDIRLTDVDQGDVTVIDISYRKQ